MPVAIADASREGALRADDPLLDWGYRAFLGVPLAGREGALHGVLAVYALQPRRWRDDEVQALQALAGNASSAISNAELYQRVALANERSHAILSNIADGIVAVNRDGDVVLWNRAAEEVTGVAASEALGHTPAAVLGRGLDVEDEGPGDRLVRIVRGDDDVWLSVTEAVMRDPAGAVAGRIYAFRDLSSERLVEEMKSDFVAAVSQELRRPLTSIYGFAETLLRRDVLFGEDERRVFLEYIASESERLAAILDALLNVARLESGDVQVTLAPTDVGPLLSEAVAVVEPEAVATVIASSSTSRPSRSRRRPMPRSCAWSCRTCSTAPYATRRTEEPSRSAHGAAAMRSRSPSPTRAWASRPASRSGSSASSTGETLAARKPAAWSRALHRAGSGRRDERLGSPSRRARAPGRASPSSCPRPLPPSPRSRRSDPRANGVERASQMQARVLVVDDEAPIRLLCRVNLEAEGMEVLEAADGQAGLELARAETPDAILLDVMMPGLDGWRVAEELLDDERTASVPIRVPDRPRRVRDRARGLDVGGIDYIMKPFNPLTLAPLVRDVLERVARGGSRPRKARAARRAARVLDSEGYLPAKSAVISTLAPPAIPTPARRKQSRRFWRCGGLPTHIRTTAIAPSGWSP